MSKLALRSTDNQRPALPPSFLYVPADRPDRFDKARVASGAIIVDLEDGVASDRKATARDLVADYLTRCDDGAGIWVRIDPSSGQLDRDLIRAVSPGIDGVMIAKADDASVSVFVSELPDVPVIALLESSAGLSAADAIAQHPSVVTFAVGEVDLLADLRIRPTPATVHVIDALRLEIVRAAARNGLVAPLAPTSTDFTDMAAFRASTEHVRDLGFRSRTAIHPRQCPVIVGAFTPQPDDIERATALLERLAEAGGGVALDERGRLIDAAVVRDAREILSRANDPRVSK